MVAKIIFLFIPSLVCAIGIKIDVSSDPRVAKAAAFGEHTDIISETERNTFGLNDGNLKDSFGKFTGTFNDKILNFLGQFAVTRADEAYVHGDLHKRFDYAPVRTTIRPINAVVLGVKMSPVILATKHHVNHENFVAEYSAEMSHEVETSITSTISKGGAITVGSEVSCTVEFAAGSVGGKTSLSFNHNWGESKSETRLKTFSTKSSVKINLQPGQASDAVLSANQGTMEVEVEYEASLTGCLVFKYDTHVRNPDRRLLAPGWLLEERFWPVDVNSFLERIGSPMSFKYNETITIGFYTDDTVAVYPAVDPD